MRSKNKYHAFVYLKQFCILLFTLLRYSQQINNKYTFFHFFYYSAILLDTEISIRPTSLNYIYVNPNST